MIFRFHTPTAMAAFAACPSHDPRQPSLNPFTLAFCHCDGVPHGQTKPENARACLAGALKDIILDFTVDYKEFIGIILFPYL